MEGNLFDVAKGYWTPDVVKRASALVGEGPEATERAMDLAIPSIFAALGRGAPGGAESAKVLRMLDDTGLRGNAAGPAARLAEGSGEELIELGKDLLARIFGDRRAHVSAEAASAAGVKASSMSSLLALAAPLALGALGRELHARKLDIRGLGALLAEQRDASLAALPRPLATAIAGPSAPRADATTRGAKLWPLLVVVPALVIGALFLRSRAAHDPTLREGLGVGLPQDEARARAQVDITLPSGEQIRVAEGSESHALAVFLATPSAEAPRRFALEEVEIDPETGNLTEVSRTSLDTVAAVLNAYPNAQVRVESRAEGNMADAVKAALVERGVPAERLSTGALGRPSGSPTAGPPDDGAGAIVVTRK